MCRYELFIEGNWSRLHVSSVSFSGTALNNIGIKLFYLFGGSLVEHVISLGILCRYVFVQRGLASYHLMTDSMGGKGNSFALSVPCLGSLLPLLWAGSLIYTRISFPSVLWWDHYGGTRKWRSITVRPQSPCSSALGAHILLSWLPSLQVLRAPVRSTSVGVKHYSTSACLSYLLTYCHTAADVDKMLRQSLFTDGIHLAVGMPFSPQSLPRLNTALCLL